MADARPEVPQTWERFFRRYGTVNPQYVAALRTALQGTIPNLAEIHAAIHEALGAAGALARQDGLAGFAAWTETFSHPLPTTPLADRTATREAAFAAAASVRPLGADDLSDDELIRLLLARPFPTSEAADWAMYAAARAALESLPPSDPARRERAHWLALLAWDLAGRPRP